MIFVSFENILFSFCDWKNAVDENYNENIFVKEINTALEGFPLTSCFSYGAGSQGKSLEWDTNDTHKKRTDWFIAFLVVYPKLKNKSSAFSTTLDQRQAISDLRRR